MFLHVKKIKWQSEVRLNASQRFKQIEVGRILVSMFVKVNIIISYEHRYVLN